jgi:hypothetical protein
MNDNQYHRGISPIPPPSLPNENLTQNEDKISEAPREGEGIILIAKQVSPPQPPNPYGQTGKSGDVGGTFWVYLVR